MSAYVAALWLLAVNATNSIIKIACQNCFGNKIIIPYGCFTSTLSAPSTNLTLFQFYGAVVTAVPPQKSLNFFMRKNVTSRYRITYKIRSPFFTNS